MLFAGNKVTSAQIERQVGDALVAVRLRGLVLIEVLQRWFILEANVLSGRSEKFISSFCELRCYISLQKRMLSSEHRSATTARVVYVM